MAAHICAAATATDTGWSIRQPAAFTGTVTFTLTITNTAITTFSNVIGGVGHIRIDAGPTGVVNFFGISSYSGGTTIVSGTVTVNSDRSLGVGLLTLSGGALQANAAVTLPNPILVNGPASISGGSTLTITGGVTLLEPTNSIAVRNNALTTFTNVINGAGQVILNAAAGTLSLPAINTYTGGTAVAAGTLLAHNALSFGTGPLHFNGGRFLPTVALTFANPWTADGDAVIDAAHDLSFTGFGNLLGTSNLTIRNNAVVTLTHSAFVNITGTGRITKLDGGTLVLTSNSDFQGGVTLIGGTLRVGHNNALGTGLFTFGGGTLRADTPVTLSNSVNVIAPATIGGTVNLGMGGTGTTNLAAAGVLIVTNTAQTTLNQTISGPGSLVVSAGTVSLTGNNTYTGLTNVTAGLLLILGSQASSPVSVTGGALGGTGTTGPVTVLGGTLQPGLSPGLLRAGGNVNLSSASRLILELNGVQAGTGYDRVAVNGVLDLNSDGALGSLLDLRAGFLPELETSFTVLQATGGIRGTFQGLPEGSLVIAGNLTFRITYRGGPSGADVVLTRVLTNSTLVLVSSPNPSNPGQPVTFTAEVAAAGGATGTPTGTVTFQVGQTVLGTVALVNGRATLVTNVFTAGEYVITATYSGDGSFTPAGPATLTQRVATDASIQINRRYVAQLYRDMLGREADTAGMNAFVQILDENEATRTQVVLAIMNSQEYREKVVRDLYVKVLGRDVDSVGLAGWSSFLAQGGTEDRRSSSRSRAAAPTRASWKPSTASFSGVRSITLVSSSGPPACRPVPLGAPSRKRSWPAKRPTASKSRTSTGSICAGPPTPTASMALWPPY